MIRTFVDEETRWLFLSGRSRRLPPDIIKRALLKLSYLDSAARLDNLRVMRGSRLHALEGARFGQYSIAVNDQWRICFRFHDGDAFDVEVGDYH